LVPKPILVKEIAESQGNPLNSPRGRGGKRAVSGCGLKKKPVDYDDID